MNIHADPGDKVRYSKLRASRAYGRQEAESYLVPDTVYTVSRLEVYDYRADVYLDEFPGVKFDSLLFDDE